MEHPFLTHRHALRSCQQALELLEDMTTIASATASDARCVAERRDCHISDERVRRCVMRNASRLGTLVTDVSESCSAVEVAVPSAFSKLQSRWIALLTGSADPDLPAAVRSVVPPMVDALTTTRARHEAFEADGGSSSPSDYSDSDTESSTHETESAEEDSDDSRR